MSDLIERLKLARRMVAGQHDMATIDEAITALSPVLPDDVKLQIQIARDKHAYMLARKPEFGPPDEITANFIGELADLLERQSQHIQDLRELRAIDWRSVEQLQARVKELEAIPRDEADGFNKIIAHYQAKVQELEAALKIIESEIMPEIPNSKGWKYTPAEVARAALAERNE